MSATSQGIKFKFGGFFKQLFQRPEHPAAASTAVAPPVETAPPPSNGEPNVNGVTIPLQAVLAGFPLELQAKIRQAVTGDLSLTVPFEKVLPQLATGMVKICYGDIRRAAPQVFAPGLESDAAQVGLPLHEILSRLNPALLVRRPTQKKPVALPEEIASPFAGHGTGLSLGVGNHKPAPAAPPSAVPVPVTPVPRTGPAFDDTTTFHRKPALPSGPPAKEPIFPRKPISPVTPAPPALSADDAAMFQRKPAVPNSPLPPGSPASFKPVGADDPPLFARKPAPPAPDAAPVVPLAPQPPTAPPAMPKRPKDYLTAPPVARTVQPAHPASVTPPSPETPVLLAPLAAFAEAWPDALRQEIVQANLVDARLAMPLDLVEASLKRGRVAFSWKLLRSWLRPAAAPGVSIHDATELEMPLNVLAPLFLARQRNAAKPPRVNVDETIPNLFFGLPKPEPAQSPKPADTNFYTWAEAADQPRMDETDFKRKSPSGTDFVAKYATPNEIVSRAAALDGVAGVLIALPDGLMVASRIPPEHNGDTLAAFLPQIFSKVSGCTKELRMGDLNNLNFTVGNVPWKIFRVNAIFFAAFGCAGEQMPTSELVALAAELDRRR
jgi:predicted regulator of Ras-like GTPase activity (Roadblock/LC7/MglB family)